MAKLKKILAKVLAGSKNIAFTDFVLLVEGFGFRLSQTSGSHHIFIHPNVKELVNLQKKKLCPRLWLLRKHGWMLPVLKGNPFLRQCIALSFIRWRLWWDE